MYRSLSQHLKERFGCKVYKLAIDAGFTCPNRDGTLGTEGCSFCSAAGGGDFAAGGENIAAQLEAAKQRVLFKNKKGKYIAYLQSFTNTYAPVEKLRQIYTQAMAPEDVVGLSIGTRPDCLPEDVIRLLAELNDRKPISVELGLQTIHDETARLFHRGYDTAVYFEAVRKLKAAGIEVVTHIILGLPGEDLQKMLQTTQVVVDAGTDGIKFHLLHILKGSVWESAYRNGQITCLSMETYAQILKQCLALVPPNVVIHRITGDGAKKDLIAPLWSADKKAVLAYLHQVLQE